MPDPLSVTVDALEKERICTAIVVDCTSTVEEASAKDF
jgi:hypothetical protein